MPRLLLALVVAATCPAVAQNRETFWAYDSLPPSLSIPDIERRFGDGLGRFFALDSVRCDSRSEPGLWGITSAKVEPFGYFLVGRPDAFHLIAAATDSVIQYRVEQGRRERIAHGGGGYSGNVASMDAAQYHALAAMAVEAVAWCEREQPLSALIEPPGFQRVIEGTVRNADAGVPIGGVLVQCIRGDHVVAEAVKRS